MFTSCFNYIQSKVSFVQQSREDKLNIALGKMAHQIVLEYFSKFRCILIIMEGSSGARLIENSFPTEIQRYSVHTDQQNSNYTLVEDMMLKALDDKCLGYIFMVSDPMQIVLSFTRMCKKSDQRVNRKLLFLPTNRETDSSESEEFSSPEDVLNMNEMDFFPDLVIARFANAYNIVDSSRIELVTHAFSGKVTARKPMILDIWVQRLV